LRDQRWPDGRAARGGCGLSDGVRAADDHVLDEHYHLVDDAFEHLLHVDLFEHLLHVDLLLDVLVDQQHLDLQLLEHHHHVDHHHLVDDDVFEHALHVDLLLDVLVDYQQHLDLQIGRASRREREYHPVDHEPDHHNAPAPEHDHQDERCRRARR